MKSLPFSSQNYPVQRVGIFSELDLNLLEILNNEKKTYEFDRGEILYHEDSAVTGLYFLQQGLVKHYKTSMEGKEYIFRLANQGDFLEFESLLNEENFFTTAKTLHSGIVHFIPSTVIKEVLQKDPLFSQEVLKRMADRIRRSNIERIELAMGDVRERLAHLLAFLAQEHGKKEETGIKINLNVTISEIAEMIGTAPETASRHLKDFREEALIANHRNNIRVIDLNSLQSLGRLH